MNNIMASTKKIKVTFLGLSLLLFILWLTSSALTNVLGVRSTNDRSFTPDPNFILTGDDDYVGSETCKACHEAQFNKVAKTKHGKLVELAAWKGKVTGCESCHGPGKQHVEGGGDKTKIKVFTAMNSKAVSETCLACHAGKETHNEFRRGEHWRNNIGCTDCHSAHGGEYDHERTGSMVLVAPESIQKPGQADDKMLKQSEPQLCMSCHNETKANFQKPFHHKVLEGTMRCSDCHNPHGGFETKQTKLAVGADSACIRCHANKQGPFVYEHAPLKLEGCTVCHIPHGSSNPKMLKRATVRQLCIECHTGITEQLTEDAAVPSFHNQAGVKYQQCTVCHSAIHGSNSNKDFFR
jgi:predicted CXXCH cytochrome family protein